MSQTGRVSQLIQCLTHGRVMFHTRRSQIFRPRFKMIAEFINDALTLLRGEPQQFTEELQERIEFVNRHKKVEG